MLAAPASRRDGGATCWDEYIYSVWWGVRVDGGEGCRGLVDHDVVESLSAELSHDTLFPDRVAKICSETHLVHKRVFKIFLVEFGYCPRIFLVVIARVVLV